MSERADKIKHVIEVFGLEECQCGRTKRGRTFFCYMCFSKLPGHMKTGLYQPIGSGAEETHEEAAEWLWDKEDRG